MEVLMAESCAQPGAGKPQVAFVGATLDQSLARMATPDGNPALVPFSSNKILKH